MQEETVTAVQVHTVYALRDVTIQNADGSVETIDTTDSHPFYVQGQGWVSADDLTAGETLSTPDGQTATVVGTVTVAEAQGVLVYNFTVADDHTYFVEGFGSATSADGTTGSSAGPLDAVWVHNSCDFEGHHGIPKFLGGDPEQELYGVESAWHTGPGSFREAQNLIHILITWVRQHSFNFIRHTCIGKLNQ